MAKLQCRLTLKSSPTKLIKIRVWAIKQNKKGYVISNDKTGPPTEAYPLE